MLDGTHFFECQCGSSEHTLRFVLDKDPDAPAYVIYTSIYLNDWRSLWERVWVGLKYIFGYRCQYGHWDTWELREDDVRRLRDMCDELINAAPTKEQK